MAERQADYSREQQARVGECIMHLSAHMQGYRVWQVSVTGLSIRGPKAQGNEFLITLRGIDAEQQKWVAFHSSFELGDAIRGAITRAMNGTLTWKEDKFVR